MAKIVWKLLAFATLTLSGCASGGSPVTTSTDPAGEPPIRNIILMVADGAGIGTWSLGYDANPDLAVRSMPVVGLVATASALDKVTDSAAGASAYATGTRTTNRTISVGPPEACPRLSLDTDPGPWPEGCRPLETWFEVARSRGRATALVTTTSVVDATPAAFAAHSPTRYWTEEIAVDFAAFGLDVLLGAGRAAFDAGEREDGEDLLGRMCATARCLSAPAELADYVADDRPLVGVFGETDRDERARLPDMVRAALSRLERAPDGFVAMFESEATDESAHDNLAHALLTADILEFDEAVAIALDFARRTPGTLVVVTADHETGGVSLVEDAGPEYTLGYITPNHTGALVPLFAEGPGADGFGGLRDNFEIGQSLMAIVRAW
jgi:alkaline phosphatase